MSILYWWTQFAVIVFGPLIVIVVDVVYQTRSPVQPPKRYRSVSPSAGPVVETATMSFSGCHPFPGLTVPPGAVDEIVRKYSVVKIAVSVRGWSTRTVRDGFTFPSLHAENEKRLPRPTVCGDGTRRPTVAPESHQFES